MPIIGALAAGLSLYDWNEQTTEEKGGTVGSLAGGTAGAALGSFLGPVGTVVGGMAGAWIGQKLGEVVAPKIEKWTRSLIAADLPGRMSAAWDTLVTGLQTWFKAKIEGIKEFGHNVGTAASETGKHVADDVAGNVDIHYAGGEKQIKNWIKTGNYTALTNKIAEQWASQKNTKGVGAHDGDGLNTARHGGYNAIKQIAQQLAKQGEKDEVATSSIPLKIETPKTPEALATFAQNAEMPTIKSSFSSVPIITPKATVSTTPAYIPPKPVQLVEPQVVKKIGGNDVTKVHVINSNDSISQNISDRQLAHAVTGGLGMRNND